MSLDLLFDADARRCDERIARLAATLPVQMCAALATQRTNHNEVKGTAIVELAMSPRFTTAEDAEILLTGVETAGAELWLDAAFVMTIGTDAMSRLRDLVKDAYRIVLVNASDTIVDGFELMYQLPKSAAGPQLLIARPAQTFDD